MQAAEEDVQQRTLARWTSDDSLHEARISEEDYGDIQCLGDIVDVHLSEGDGELDDGSDLDILNQILQSHAPAHNVHKA